MDSGYFFVNAALRHGKRTRLNHNKLKRDVELALQNDEWNDVRLGHSTYLKAQLEARRNEIQRAKYITFGIQADCVKEARIKLRRVEDDLPYPFGVILP